jgi:LPS sulfotransferase NodH
MLFASKHALLLRKAVVPVKPSLCYWLCATPRSGSTALCHALAATAVAGGPGEHLSLQNRERALAEFGGRSFPELLEHVRQATTTPNGVFGLKVMGGGYLESLLGEVQSLRCDASLAETLADAFPELRLVFLTRRNKVRQAVSHWRAIQSDLWHLPRDGRTKPPPEDAYRFEAIDTLVHDIVMREAAWQGFFDQIERQPLTIAYEDFAAAPEAVIRQVLHYLGLEPDPGWRLGELPLRPIADMLSESWAQRYRSERQAKWERVIW